MACVCVGCCFVCVQVLKTDSVVGIDSEMRINSIMVAGHMGSNLILCYSEVDFAKRGRGRGLHF